MNTKAKRRVLLDGHCDQIGMMVKHISREGYLTVSALGGVDAAILLASKVTVYTAKGPILGIIGRKPPHLQTPDERDKGKVDFDKLWIDIGAKNQAEADKKVKIGDLVTFELGVSELPNGLIVSPGLDNRVGLFVVLEAFRLVAKKKLSVALFAVSSVAEEIGLRGAKTAAYRVDPEVAIAVDVTHATDSPATDGMKMPPCRLGHGPAVAHGPNVNPKVRDRLIQAAKSGKIAYQPAPSSVALSNNANIIQISRNGVATGALGIPNRYMHSPVEVCSLVDLENAARLLAGFIEGIRSDTDFRPFVVR